MAKSLHGFDEGGRRVNPLTVLEIAIIVVCAVLIVTMLSCYFMFSGSGATPKFFGKTVYVTDAANMEPNVPAGSAIFSTDENLGSVTTGDVVLFRITDSTVASGGEVTGVLRIQGIETDDTGVYYVLHGDANAATETIRVPQASIIGKCVSYDATLGAVISFTTSTMGLLTVVIIPCLLLIVFQVVRIIRIKSEDTEDDEEDDEFYEDLDDEEIPVPVRKPQPQPQAEQFLEFGSAARKGQAVNAYKEMSAPTKKRVPVEEPREEIPAAAKRREVPVQPLTESVQEERPLNKLYVDGEGAAQFRKNPEPTATNAEFRQSVKRDTAENYQNEIPSFRKRPSQVNNAYKPNSYNSDKYTAEDLIALAEAAEKKAEATKYEEETETKIYYERPVRETPREPVREPIRESAPVVVAEEPAPEQPVQQPVRRGYEIPKLREPFADDENSPLKMYYNKPAEEHLAPPVVENPVDVTIPAEAVKPVETIAPPPKKTANKTVEELMKMIDSTN